MKKLIVMGLVLFATTGFAKEKIKKHRDRIRTGGFSEVRVEITAEEIDGVVKIIRKDIYCKGDGDMKCKDPNIIAPGTELDEMAWEYTPAERNIAQDIMNIGDMEIDRGVTSGHRINTVEFHDEVNQVSYYRTFTYTWVTNSLKEVSSVLDISDKF